MADDEKWPSEGEDFDATIDKSSKATATAPKKVEVSEEVSEETNEAVESQTQTDDTSDAVSETYEQNDSETTEDSPSEPERPEDTSSESEAETKPETASSEVDPPEHKPPVAAVTAASSAPKKGGSKGRLAFEILLVLLVIGLGLWSWTLYSDKQNLENQVAKLNANPQIVAQKQSQELIAKVGKLMDLPQNESPTIATVSDANAARKQSVFFTNAQNGDKVLMYVKAGEAILYRPSTNKIVLVGPLTFNNNSSSSSSSSSSTTTPKTTTSSTKTNQ